MSLPGKILRAGLIPPGSRCLLAASGGPDSTALCAALAELSGSGRLPLELRLAHLDHAIRPESARDAGWVADLARRLDLGCVSERGDAPALKGRERLSLEEAARKLRMEFLERAARAWGATHVATGHTQDDQAETVLFRLIRGTGLAGLGGIPPSRPLSAASPDIRLVRPMLGCTRAEVLEYLEARGLDCLTDETNFDVELQARARIRHELLPRLAGEHNPEVRAALARLAESAREAQSALAELAAARLKGLEPRNGALRLPLGALEAPMALRVEVLAQAAERLGLPGAANRRLLAEAARELPRVEVGKRFDLGELAAVRDYRHVIIGGREPQGASPKPGAWEVEVAVPGETRLPAGLLRAERVEGSGFDMAAFCAAKSRREEVFDARLLAGGKLVCRARRPGDRFHPLGAAGHRKLKDFFIDGKVPRRQRSSVPLLVLEGEVLWVLGHRLSERARVPQGAAGLVRMEFEPEA